MRWKCGILCCLVLAGCAVSSVTGIGDTRLSESPTIELHSPGFDKRVTVFVEIADDPQERARGLMERQQVPWGTGMLFLFPTSQQLSFWMKNTLVPLDILYFDARGVFVSSATMEPCAADPCRTYPSAGSAMYALEVPAGFAKEQEIASGWTLSLPH
ncbi:MAG: hypothetical protein Greene041619_388 [Candidatus Peregrinibacteria bacterium Greene0416_19]|nr:MAG: hypothetical protein Greene041619_388 [Candidatus Peregrinibacteria bacterium Greene0416_19]